MLGNINNKLLISIVMFICQMPIICFINSFYLVNYFVFLSGYFPHQFVTAMSRIEFGKVEKILCGRGWYQICTDWLTDWLFIVNLQLEVTHTDWQRLIFCRGNNWWETKRRESSSPSRASYYRRLRGCPAESTNVRPSTPRATPHPTLWSSISCVSETETWTKYSQFNKQKPTNYSY